MMFRVISGFHRDEFDDWVAELDCLHNQHVRHKPPFQNRPWVVNDDERRKRIGTLLDCTLCDRCELPDGLHLKRSAGPWTDSNLPNGLKHQHAIAKRTWGVLLVLHGTVTFTIQVSPVLRRSLNTNDSQPIPPGVAHEITLGQGAEIKLQFLSKA